jgi:hypothetical protein
LTRSKKELSIGPSWIGIAEHRLVGRGGGSGGVR